MSLEDAIRANTEAVNKLTALLTDLRISAVRSVTTESEAEDVPEKTTGRRGAAKTDKADKAEKVKEETKSTSKFTAEHVKAAAVKVKDKLGTDKAKKLIADHGAEKLDALKPEVYDDFIDAAEKLLAGGDEEASEDDDL